MPAAPEAWQNVLAHVRQHFGGSLSGRISIAASDEIFRQSQGEQFNAFDGISRAAPWIIGERAQKRRSWPLPRRGGIGTVQRIEGEAEIFRQRPMQGGVTARAITPWHAHQGHQQFRQLPPFRNGAQYMQAVADLRFLDFAKPGVEAHQVRFLVLTGEAGIGIHGLAGRPCRRPGSIHPSVAPVRRVCRSFPPAPWAA